MFKFKSLKTKLVVMIGLIISLCFTVTLTFVTTQITQMAKESAFEEATQISENHGNYIKSEIEVGLDTSRTLSDTFKALINSNSGNLETLNYILKNILIENPNFIDAWIILESNPQFEDDHIKKLYSDTKNSRIEAISDPYFHNINGKEALITSLIVPIINNNEFIGIVSIDISLETIQEEVKDIRLFETGYGALISNNGIYTAHKEESHLGKDIGNTKERLEAKEAIKKGESYHAIIKSNSTNEEVYRYFTPIQIGETITPWSFAVSIPMDSILSKANNIRNYSIILGLISILVSLLIVYLLINTITKPIIKTTHMLKDISEGEGDLTKRLEVLTDDEIGELSTYFNIFIQRIQNLISQVKNNADILAESSSQITIAMDESNRGIEEITNGITNIASSSQDNANIVDESNNKIDALNKSSLNISDETKATFETSKDVLNSVHQGAENIKEVVDSNNKVKEATNKVYQSIEELKSSSDEVGTIVSIITGISEQTNLLALNASIEAARAGEHGRGFAVVADEVRKLAEESKKSSDQIVKLINDIQSKASNANKSIIEGQSLVNISVQKSNIINDHFKNILNSVEGINDKIELISDLSNTQSKITTTMSTSMNQISSLTQENVDSVEQINQIVEEQAASFEEITASVEELNNMAQNLKNETDQFRV